jgi:dUTP pyrophosphatase
MGETAITRRGLFGVTNGYHNCSYMKIRIKKLSAGAAVPEYAHGASEDAGLDLRALERTVLSPGQSAAVPTGLAIELPAGYEAQVRPRSGMALKHSVTVNFGTIDPGYRGEIRVIMFNLGRADYVVEKGDRIAQLIIARYESIEWEEGELTDSRRGEGGFGSSGR